MKPGHQSKSMIVFDYSPWKIFRIQAYSKNSQLFHKKADEQMYILQP